MASLAQMQALENSTLSNIDTRTMAGRTAAVQGTTAGKPGPFNTATQTSEEHSVQNALDPQSLALLQGLVQVLNSGGTTQQKTEINARKNAQDQVGSMLGDFTKQAAYQDAQDLMAQQLRLSLQKQMPALQRAVEGSGTSASSMQGLLANQLATESAQAAGALGAEQAKAYGAIRAQLAATLEGLTRPQNTVENSLLQALQILKGAQTNVDATKSTVSTQPIVPTTAGGISARVGGGGGAGGAGPSDYAMPDFTGMLNNPFNQLLAANGQGASAAAPKPISPSSFDPLGDGTMVDPGEIMIRPATGPQGYDWTNQTSGIGDFDSSGGNLIW